MTRKECLEEAIRIVTKDRNATHGEPEDSFGEMAAYWSQYLKDKPLPLQSHDVAAMMILFKVARIKHSPQNSDNWVDAVGYGACGVEVVKPK